MPVIWSLITKILTVKCRQLSLKKNQINLYKVQINLNEFNVRDTEKPPFNKIKRVALPSFCSPSQSSLAFLINSLRFEASSFKESICFWKQKQKIIMKRRFGPPLWLILSFRCRDKSVYCPYQNLFLAIFNVTRPRLPLKLPELVQEECSLPWFPTSVLTPLSLGQTWFAGSLGLNTTQQRIKNRALYNNVYHIQEIEITIIIQMSQSEIGINVCMWKEGKRTI